MAEEQKRVSTTVPLDWKEVWFTNCPMVSANNVDQELGWCREEFKKIGVEYAYFRHAPENNWYPHYIHNLDNLIRFGVRYGPILLKKDFGRGLRAILIQDEHRMSKIDSKYWSRRFDNCASETC